MLNYIARRSLLSLLILMLAVSLLFFMIHMVPGDPSSVILGPKASPELKAELNARMGHPESPANPGWFTPHHGS